VSKLKAVKFFGSREVFIWLFLFIIKTKKPTATTTKRCWGQALNGHTSQRCEIAARSIEALLPCGCVVLL
jgi:hypothetical protein